MSHTPGKMVAVETRLYFPAEQMGTNGGVDFKHAPNGADDAKRAAKCWNEFDGLVDALRKIALTDGPASEAAFEALARAGEAI